MTTPLRKKRRIVLGEGKVFFALGNKGALSVELLNKTREMNIVLNVKDVSDDVDRNYRLILEEK